VIGTAGQGALSRAARRGEVPQVSPSSRILRPDGARPVPTR
jgi:hypothetical protein